jgi:hypothetical protein
VTGVFYGKAYTDYGITAKGRALLQAQQAG